MKNNDLSKSLNGIYRAKVVDSDDPEEYGRVKVWIPDIMPEVDETKGLWANPANTPIGGLNANGDADHYYQGMTFIPSKGSWVWVFFENGRAERPFYFAALNLKNAKILPENRVGSQKSKKWVPFKSHAGRTIVISDDPDDERVEITGKKRQMSSPPSGDTASVYTIDGNQTTILLDERSGKEKILIRTHKGDFINIDIENQKLQIKFKSDITIESEGSIYFKSASDINFKATGNINSESSAIINNKASGVINSDGSQINDMTGASSGASESPPSGDRD